MAATATLKIVSAQTEFCSGDLVVVDVRLDVALESANAQQGTVLYDATALKLEAITTGGTINRFWTQQPQEKSTGIIVWGGGLPTPGFIGKDARLFRMTFSVQREGTTELKIGNDALVLLNDGNGTAIPLTLQAMTMDVKPSTAKVCYLSGRIPQEPADTVPPEPFQVLLTRTEFAYDGAPFASFVTTDEQSGLAYYEARENGGQWQRTDSPYVLKTKSGPVLIEVRAVDMAGNERIASASGDFVSGFGYAWWWWLLPLVLLIAMYVTYRKIRSMRGSHNGSLSASSKDMPKVQYYGPMNPDVP